MNMSLRWQLQACKDDVSKHRRTRRRPAKPISKSRQMNLDHFFDLLPVSDDLASEMPCIDTPIVTSCDADKEEAALEMVQPAPSNFVADSAEMPRFSPVVSTANLLLHPEDDQDVDVPVAGAFAGDADEEECAGETSIRKKTKPFPRSQ